MGFLDRFKKKPADTTRRSRVNIEQRFEIKRTAISGSMSKFFMARDRENDKTIGLKGIEPIANRIMMHTKKTGQLRNTLALIAQ